MLHGAAELLEARPRERVRHVPIELHDDLAGGRVDGLATLGDERHVNAGRAIGVRRGRTPDVRSDLGCAGVR